MNPVFSIGHSDHAVEDFVALLARHGVSAVADVRAAPYSRHHPQFSKAALMATLRSAGVAYVYLGEALGGLPSARVRSQMRGSGYGAMAATEAFREGIARVGRGREQHRIALMCAERDPIDCHRALLVGRALAGAGVAVEHIHANGETEGQAALERRLLDAAGRGEGGDLFATPSELLDLAYLRQEQRAGLIDEEQGAE